MKITKFHLLFLTSGLFICSTLTTQTALGATDPYMQIAINDDPSMRFTRASYPTLATNYAPNYQSYVSQYNNMSSDKDGLPRQIASHGERVFVFSPKVKRWAAYDPEGFQVAAGVANGGADYCQELGKPCQTPQGAFRVQHKGSVDCVSKKFPLGVGGAPMPYCMFFGSGFAIHGSPWVSERNGSHGCIRVQTSAAAWLHRYFIQPGTKVLVLPY